MIYIANCEAEGKRREGVYIINHKNQKEFYYLNDQKDLVKKSSQEIKDIIFEERIK